MLKGSTEEHDSKHDNDYDQIDNNDDDDDDDINDNKSEQQHRKFDTQSYHPYHQSILNQTMSLIKNLNAEDQSIHDTVIKILPLNYDPKLIQSNTDDYIKCAYNALKSVQELFDTYDYQYFRLPRVYQPPDLLQLLKLGDHCYMNNNLTNNHGYHYPIKDTNTALRLYSNAVRLLNLLRIILLKLEYELPQFKGVINDIKLNEVNIGLDVIKKIKLIDESFDLIINSLQR